MILQALVKYYENLAEQGKVSRLGWCHAKVSYEINLSSEGDIIGITSRKIEDMRGKKVVWVPANLVVPEMVTRSSGVAANFLCDNSKYMLGIDADGTNSRVVDCFQATKEKHGQILQSAQGKTARAILAYFEKWDPQKASEHPVIRENWEELTEGGNLIFSVEGQEAIGRGMVEKITAFAWLPVKKPRYHESIKQSKEYPGHSPAERRWYHSMHRHLSLMERNRVIMRRWENMRNLHIPRH